MLRILLALAVLVSFTLFVRHQYNYVIKQVVKPTTNPFPVSKMVPEAQRHKCMLCGGTGKAPSFYLGVAKKSSEPARPCPSCNGTGYVVDPFFPKP